MWSDISDLEEFCECGLIWNFKHFDIFINGFIVALLIVHIPSYVFTYDDGE
jgi:uncharacterized membrane protein